MSFRIGKVIVIEDPGDAECEFCHVTKEVRPYGPGGKACCWECGQATPELRAIIEHNMGVLLFGKKGELK